MERLPRGCIPGKPLLLGGDYLTPYAGATPAPVSCGGLGAPNGGAVPDKSAATKPLNSQTLDTRVRRDGGIANRPCGASLTKYQAARRASA
jgi:hypothetical protein